MDDYNRGKRDIMLEMANDDLLDVASRIAVLEEDLDAARKLKWDLVRKISLLESDAAFECLASGEKLSAFALTEPGAGSDLTALKTTAELQGDHYLVNGEKLFIPSLNL